VELVLQFPDEESPYEVVEYYLVDHNSKCLFWREGYEVSMIYKSWNVQGPQRDRQTGMLTLSLTISLDLSLAGRKIDAC
jgi:hypothetical protein